MWLHSYVEFKNKTKKEKGAEQEIRLLNTENGGCQGDAGGRMGNEIKGVEGTLREMNPE